MGLQVNSAPARFRPCWVVVDTGGQDFEVQGNENRAAILLIMVRRGLNDSYE